MRWICPVVLFVLAINLNAREVLVNTDWLAKNQTAENVRIVEVSVDPGLFEKGHIAGAVNFRWHTDLCDTVKRDILSKENFEKLLSNAGIANDTTIVVYGDNNNWFAAWAVWIMTVYGHEDVRILDGGRKKWELEKRPMSTTADTFKATQYNLGAAASIVMLALVACVIVPYLWRNLRN